MGDKNGEIISCLDEVFETVLKNKGLFPAIKQTLDFPFEDFQATVSAIRSGKARLSFGAPSPTAFNAVATGAEQNLHMIGVMTYLLIAPLVLVAGAITTGNYWLLLCLLLLFPLAFFGTHQNYKKAPLFLVFFLAGAFWGVVDQNIAFLTVSAFLLTATAGFSYTRRLYNKVLICRALEIESALMFLLGCNHLQLCGERWSLLWTPKWIEQRSQ